MSLFWHSSPEERGRVVRTLNELGPTTVPGLSAALSWPEKRTERLVRELASSGEGGVVFYDATRRVEIPAAPAPSRADAAIPAVPLGPAGPGNGPSAVPAPSAPAVGPKWGGRSTCPGCSGTMEPTANGEALVCRECGRISNLPRSSRAPPAVGPSPIGAPSNGGPSSELADRRLQELFAAYVTSRPVICPKCKTPLRHQGLGMYGCPACGQVVRFSVGARAGPATH
jgi:predicted RNA-binding Zn-ribbon protein involved in translation (DUF1610 family)